MINNNQETINCVIAGSGKNPLYFEAVKKFQREGFTILAPHSSPIVPNANRNGFWLQEENLEKLGLREDDFNRLSPEEKTTITQEIETHFIQQILKLDPTRGDFLYVVTKPDGTIGASASGEIMVALQNQIPTYFSQAPIDPHYPYPLSNISSSKLISQIKTLKRIPIMPTNEYLKFLINPRKAVGGILTTGNPKNPEIILQYRESWGAYTLPGTLVPHGILDYEYTLRQYLYNQRDYTGGEKSQLIGIFPEIQSGGYKGRPISRDFIDYQIKLPYKILKSLEGKGLITMSLKGILQSDLVEPNTQNSVKKLLS